MRITLLVICTFNLYLWRVFYCGNTIEQTSASASVVQRLVIQQVVSRIQVCICSEIRVKYRVRLNDGFVADHIAHYDAGKKTLRIETDPGSGWQFGWEDVDEKLLRQVLQQGGQFSLLTKYRPNGRYVPSGMMTPF